MARRRKLLCRSPAAPGDHGARAVLVSAARQRAAEQPLSRLHHWALTVRDRRGHNKATIAVANKLGRLVWAVWTKDVPYTMPAAA